MAIGRMINPILNQPRIGWYKKLFHNRIPAIAESKKWIDAFYAHGIVPVGPSVPVIASATILPTSGDIGTLFQATAGGVTGYPTPVKTYQWFLDTVLIVGATSASYLSANAGSLTVVITVTNSEGSDSALSAAVVVVAAPPVVTNAGTVSGGKIGSALSVTGFAYTGTEPVTVTYQWRDGVGAISGATAATYTPVESDNLDNIYRRTTATNSGGADAADTPAVAITYNAPVASVGTYAWTVPLSDPPQTLNAKPFFTVAIGAGFDTDHSSMTGQWLLTGTPGSDAVFTEGVFVDGAFAIATGPDVDISIDAVGVITLSYDAALVDVSFGVIGANSGGDDEKTITVNTTDAWDILDVAGLFAYWNTNVLSSVWANTAGTTPATVGVEVARRDDLSGNGRHQIWTAAGSAPTLEIDGNGKYYLNFADGTVDRMTVAGIPVPLGINMAKYAAVQRGTQTGAFSICRTVGSLNSNDYISFQTTTSGRITLDTRVLSATIAAIITSTPAVNVFDNSAPKVLSGYVPANPGTQSLKINNVVVGTVTSGITTTYGTTVTVNAHGAGTNQPVNFRNYAQAEFSAIPGASDDLEIINLMASACGVTI